MGDTTAIEWCDATFNPWEGCQKVSPGCDNCYAEARNKRYGSGVAVNWGPGAPRRRTSATNWKLPLKWNRLSEQWVRNGGQRTRVFCASLADVFDHDVPTDWRRDLYALIEATPNLDWLLLTKRIGNAKAMLNECALGRWDSAPLPNVWLGATVVNQVEADRDIPKLLATPARKRFLSIEPMLGPIDLKRWLPSKRFYMARCNGCGRMSTSEELGACEDDCWCTHCFSHDITDIDGIDWVIVGGESGLKARPMHPDWVRSLRDQCAAAGVPFLFKQWGEWTPGENVTRQRGVVDTAFWDGEQWTTYPLNLTTDHGHIDDQPDLYLVGKKAAGRHLDGRTHDEFPELRGGAG